MQYSETKHIFMSASLSLKPSILCWKSVILFLWFLIPRIQAPGGLKSNLYSKPSSSTVLYYWAWTHRDFTTKSRRQLLQNTLEGPKNNYSYTQLVLQSFLPVTCFLMKVIQCIRSNCDLLIKYLNTYTYLGFNFCWLK